MSNEKTMDNESTMELMARAAGQEAPEAQAAPAAPAPKDKPQYPSVALLTCPNCGQKQFKIIGTKGSLGKAIVGAGMFGAVGNMVMDSRSKENFELLPVKYQCLSCKNKFEALPLVAEDEEVLDTPCTIVFHRLGSPVGMAVSQQVFLNGVKMGSVKNKADLEFQTHTKQNTIFVTDQYGVAFPGEYTFTAENGGFVEINYKRKFL